MFKTVVLLNNFVETRVLSGFLIKRAAFKGAVCKNEVMYRNRYCSPIQNIGDCNFSCYLLVRLDGAHKVCQFEHTRFKVK